jgi:hypothetical protein
VSLVSEEEASALFGGSLEAIEAIVSRFAELRELPMSLLSSVVGLAGHPIGRELEHWIKIYERYDLDAVDPASAELMAPAPSPDLTGLLDPSSPVFLAELVGFFSAATPVVETEGMTFLASLAGTTSGVSKIYYFHPQDWGLWPTDASLTARLFRTVQEEDRPEQAKVRFEGEAEARRVQALKLYEALHRPETLAPDLDPPKLFQRSAWLVHALAGVGTSFEIELAKAMAHDAYAEERRLLAQRPHLLTYWLWAHWFFDDKEGLEQTLGIAADALHPVVAGSKKAIDGILAGEKLRVGQRDHAELLELKEQLLERAPPPLLSAPARHRRNQRRAEKSEASRAEIEALAALEAADEPLVKEALLLLAHLELGGAVPPERAPIHGGLDVRQAIERLAELMDPRFLPIIDARMRRAAAVGDTHRDASFGLIYAYAALEPDFGKFSAAIAAAGTGNYGPRRLEELYRAYGRYADPRATKILADGARAWLREVDDWIRMAPGEPLIQLLSRDTLETHELIAQLLGRANYSAANFDVCVRAAEAAGELKSKRAIPGLQRAVEQRLGRIDDGGRAKVIRAYAIVAGAEALPTLRARFKIARERWESADEDDAPEHQYELACLLAGLLPLGAEEEELLVARTLLQLFKVRFAAARTPRRDLIEAAKAIVSAAHQADVRSLAAAIVPYTKLEARFTPLTRGPASELERAAKAALGDLQ